MSQVERHRFSGQDKVEMLRTRPVGGKRVSDSCEQQQINPSIPYQFLDCDKAELASERSLPVLEQLD